MKPQYQINEKSSKTAVLFFALAFYALTGFAQTNKIDAGEASKHVGDSLSVCGKVYGGIYLEKSKGQPTLINIGAAYPNNPPYSRYISGSEKPF